MAASSGLCYSLLFVLVCQTFGAPTNPAGSNADQICDGAQLISPGQTSMVYKYKTEVKLSVAKNQHDLESVITADVHIKNLGACNYALQLQNVKITESKDKDKKAVTSSANAQRELEKTVVRFRWVDGYVVAVEADNSANIDHLNFIKGVLSALQVYSPVPVDGETILREEDVLGVCTTRYSFANKGGSQIVSKKKDLATCSKDKLHLGSSPVLTSLFGPMIEEVFSANTRYVCQTKISSKLIQSVNCKTVEVGNEDDKVSDKHKDHDHAEGEESSEEDGDDDDDISSKLVYISQELTLEKSSSVNVDAGAVKNPVRQTLQFVPTASFDKSNEQVANLVSKLQGLLKNENWDPFAAGQFVEVTNELRRMERVALNRLKANADIKNLVPSLFNTVYSHDPAASLLNFDANTLKFSNPLSVFYTDNPSSELVDQIVQASSRLTPSQVQDFVGLAATILKTYKARQTNKDADAKIKSFHQSLGKVLADGEAKKNDIVTSILAAYAQLGVFDEQVGRLANDDKADLEVQYHALNVIRNINEDYLDEKRVPRIRTNLQNLLLRKLTNKALKNAVRIWAFEALYTPFIYNPEEEDSTLSDALEKALGNIINEPLNQINGYMWSVLKYSSLDRRCPLRGLAARLRTHANKKQYTEQATISSRRIHLDVPLRQNYQASLDLSIVMENDRAVPSFIGFQLAFDGVRRETLRLPWIEAAVINENIDENVAEYFLRLDPLNPNNNMNEDQKQEAKEKAKGRLTGAVKKFQEEFDNKDDDSSSSVHLYLKLFGADIRSRDVTAKVQDILKTNIRTYLRGVILNHLKDLAEQSPVYRLPIEIGAASAAANGLTLYKSAQLGILADFKNQFENTRDENGLGKFVLNSNSAISFSVTVQREVSSPLVSIGETVQLGALSNLPFEYSAVATPEGRVRELNFPEAQATVLATDFQYSLRTSTGLKKVPISGSSADDPSCTPSVVYRTLGLRACVVLNPFRSIEMGSRPIYPIKLTLGKDPSVKKWRIGWQFNAATAPQYEVVVEKVGATGTYPGLGISASKTGNNFDIKVLTGMKSFNVKGTKNGDKFTGKVYSSDGKEVMTTSGDFIVNSNGFKLESKLVDISSKQEVLTLTTDIRPNRGDGLVADIALNTPNKQKSFKVHFHGDIYKPNRQYFFIDGGFDLGDTSYTGLAHLEREDDKTVIKLKREMVLGKGGAKSGYSFVYERKPDANGQSIESYLSLQSPASSNPVKMFRLNSDFARKPDMSEATFNAELGFLIMTRTPPVDEQINIKYVRRSVKPASQSKRLISPQAELNVEVTTKSEIFKAVLNHRHLRSIEASKKGNEVLPPTLQIANKIHLVADTNKLLPDIPRPFAFDILSDLDLDLLNKFGFKFHYDFPLRQRSASFQYQATIDKVVEGHLFSGTSKSEVEWDNKQKTAKSAGTFSICTRSRTLTSHWDVDTSLVPDQNDIQIDLIARFDRQPKKDAPQSVIAVYNVTVKAPKHQLIQALDLDGNFTRQAGFIETFNSIAFRKERVVKEFNVNAVLQRNRTGDGTLQTRINLGLPFKYLPYITHELKVERSSASGPVNHVSSQFLAEPVFSHFADIDIDRSDASRPPCVKVENEFEYLRGNGDHLYGLSQVNVHRWSTLHSLGLFKRNNDLLHKHSIGYAFSKKTRKIALSLESPQLGGNPLSIIGELTIDRENRIGKMKWPQEFGVHLEFGTPVTNVTAFNVFYNLPMFSNEDEQTVDASLGFKLASPKIEPISFYLHSKGSLNTTLHITEALNIGDDIALSVLLTAQYDPQLTSQISASAIGKYYEQEVQNSIFALFKQHQVIVRGIMNASSYSDYRYEMDIGFDDDLLTGHTERTDGQQEIVSDITAKKCAATGKYYRCYKGDIVIRSGGSGAGNKGSFDLSWGKGTAKLDVNVANQLSLSFDHTHTGRVRDEDFSSQTDINAKSLRSDNKGAFSYSGAIDKDNGKWKSVRAKSSLSEPKSGQQTIATDFNFAQKLVDRRVGNVQRTITLNVERRGQTVFDWSSQANPCANAGQNVLHGICQKATFNVKASNQLAQRLRARFDIPADPKLSNSAGLVTYDGTLNLDLKFDPKSGPHTASLDLNRLKNDAVDLDVSFQQRTDDRPMSLNVKANLPNQPPLSLKYDEDRRSPTNYDGILKYSFNAANPAAEKTFQCSVDRPSDEDVSVNCKGERTTLTLDIDRAAGKSKIYVDLNRFEGERIGYEVSRDPQTKELDATLYTLVSSWNIKRQPGKSTTVVVTQKKKEVLRVEGVKVNDGEIQVRFSPSGVNLKLEWDNSTTITLTQTEPQQRNILSVVIDRARIRPYLPSLRNQNRPSADIDEPLTPSKKPIVQIAFDKNNFLSLSQALDKLGSHNGLYGLETVKKVFKLQIGDAPVTVYNVQHWKTHGENSQLPESYSIRVVNNANGNIVQLSTQRWDETRQITEISHSFDGGKTLTSDLKLDRNYAYPVGSVFFLHSFGSRNIEGMKQLRNFTRNFIKSHLYKDFEKSNAAELLGDLKTRLRSILDKDYAGAKEIVDKWSQEKGFLGQWSKRVGLAEFFDKYPTYTDVSNKIFAILAERREQREEFWRNRFEAILNENRLQGLSDRFQKVRENLIQTLLARAEPLVERLFPTVDQAAIDKRISNYVNKLVTAFQQFSKRNTEKWKMIFKAIDEASKGEENKWFRTLVADIDSADFAAKADAETTKMFQKLEASSKLLINNIQQLSHRITKRQKNIRERVKNAIRHIPKAAINGTNFELLFPIGRQPGSYVGTSELMMGIGSLLRNRDQAFDTIRSILQNRLESRTETLQNYWKALRSLAKRVFSRDPSLTPELKAILAESGDGLNVHGEYIFLNPQCNYLLAHDFANLQFSFQFIGGKFYSMIPEKEEIGEYQSSKTGRVRLTREKDVAIVNVPIHYGAGVNGALNSVADRTVAKPNPNKWLLQPCPAATRDQPAQRDKPILECYSNDDDEQQFCENFVRNGLRNGEDKRRLLAQVMQARQDAI